MSRYLIFVIGLATSLTACKSKEEKFAAAEEQGHELAGTKAKLLEGVGKALQEEGKGAAESVSAGVGEVVKGLAGGFDKGLGQVKVTADPGLAAKGIQFTRAARGVSGDNNGGSTRNPTSISVYVTFAQPYSGTLLLKALNAENQEIGRSATEMKEAKGSARYVDFVFDGRTPFLSSHSYQLLEQ